MRKKSIFSLIVLMTLSLVYAGEDESQNDVFNSQINAVEDWEELGVLGLGILTANVAYSSDGSRLAVGTSRGVEIWNTETWAMERWLLGHRGAVRSVSWSPDSTKIVSGSGRPDYTVKVWDIETGRELMTLPGHTHRVDSVAWSPDGKKIASAEGEFGGRRIKIWDAQNGRPLVDINDVEVLAIAWSPDSRRIAASASQGFLILWNAETGQRLLLVDIEFPSRSLSWSPTRNEIAVSSSFSFGVRIFDSETGRLLRSFGSQEASVAPVAWSPDGSLLATGSRWFGPGVQIRDAESGELLLLLRGHAPWVTSVSWSPDGSLIASGSHDAGGSFDNTIKIWDLENGRLLRDLIPDERAGLIQSISWSPDGLKIVSGSFRDNMAKIWDLETGAFVRNLNHADRDSNNRVWSVAWSPDGSKIASGGEEPMKIWEAETGRLLTSVPQGGRLLSWSPDSRKIVFGGFDRILKIWDVESGRELITFSRHQTSVISVSWSPEGSLIASGDEANASNGMLRIWDAQTGEERMSIRFFGSVGELAWSPEGSLLALRTDGEIWIWDVEAGQLLRTYEGIGGRISWSPDWSKIASHGNGFEIKIWDAETGRELKTITTGHTPSYAIQSVIWSPDGSLMASGAYDGTIRIYGSRP